VKSKYTCLTTASCAGRFQTPFSVDSGFHILDSSGLHYNMNVLYYYAWCSLLNGSLPVSVKKRIPCLIVLLLLGLQTGSAISTDESVRSYLEHFKSTRNNYVSPALKTAARDYIVKTFKDFGLDTWTEEFPSNHDQKKVSLIFFMFRATYLEYIGII
jgi:hypothetical protein